MSEHIYHDRSDAGRALARAVAALQLPAPVLVLGLPRGGVPVAVEVARALHASLDVLIVRKLGLPAQPELAMGAIASGGIVVHEEEIERRSGVTPETFARVLEAERRELTRRELRYRAGRPPLPMRGQTVVLVDDGIATGATMLAGLRAARQAGAVRVIAAAPVASADAVAALRAEGADIVVLQAPAYFAAIGQYYERFEQLGDEAVCELLHAAPSA